MSRPVQAALAAVITALVSTHAIAQPADDVDQAQNVLDKGDYDSDSERWNGLNTFKAIARGQNMVVESVENVKWDQLSGNDILVLLYPTMRIEPSHLAAFIRNGGHVLIADDFGNSNEALGRLGMLRANTSGVNAERFYRDLSYVPMAKPLVTNHPLTVGIGELATNHPAILTNTRGPDVIFGFGPDEGVVAAGSLGSGRFVVSSDPSIFINRMLQFDGNFQFAINALQYLKGDRAIRRVVILAGKFSLYGEPSDLLDDGTMRGSVSNFLSELNRWLDEGNDYLLTKPGMRIVGLIAAVLIALVAMLILPLKRKTPLDGAWIRPEAMIGLDDFEHIVDRHDKLGPRANFILPATVIRDTVNTKLSQMLSEIDPLYSKKSEQNLVHEVSLKRGQGAGHALQRVYKRLKSLPSRAQAASPWSAGYFSRREFERLYRDVEELYLALGEAGSKTDSSATTPYRDL